jgi:hypothetical protein
MLSQRKNNFSPNISSTLQQPTTKHRNISPAERSEARTITKNLLDISTNLFPTTTQQAPPTPVIPARLTSRASQSLFFHGIKF